MSSFLPRNSPARAIRAAVAGLDLSSLREGYADNGGAPYEPGAMLGIVLLGYALGESSSVEMAERCRYDVRFMYVSGGQTPSGRTLRRFRRRLESEVDALFVQVVRRCKEAGLLTLRRVALDGTKIVSAASQLRHSLSEAQKEELDELGFEAPKTSDPEAGTMKASTKFVLGYNAQAAVDCDSGVVVAVDVTTSKVDYPSLGEMASQVTKTTGSKPDDLVADGGYDSNEGICACAKLGVEVIVAVKSDSPGFWTVTPEGEILCPMGEEAVPIRQVTVKGKTLQMLEVKTCASCPFVTSCMPNWSLSNKNRGRSLWLPTGCDPTERILVGKRANSPPGKEAMRERMASIERVFADVCFNKGFRRLRLRGQAGARLEWSLIHTARNLLLLAKSRHGSFLAILARFRLAISFVRGQLAG